MEYKYEDDHPIYEYMRQKFIVDFDAVNGEAADRVSIKQVLAIIKKKFPHVTEAELNTRNLRLHLTVALANQGYLHPGGSGISYKTLPRSNKDRSIILPLRIAPGSPTGQRYPSGPVPQQPPPPIWPPPVRRTPYMRAVKDKNGQVVIQPAPPQPPPDPNAPPVLIPCPPYPHVHACNTYHHAAPR